MKIMIQNRKAIIEQPRQVWVNPICLGVVDENSPEEVPGYIMSNSPKAPVLGEYKSITRAKEVLLDLFEAQRRGEINYCMPQE